MDNVHYSWDVRCFLEGSFAETILRPVDALDRLNFHKSRFPLAANVLDRLGRRVAAAPLVALLFF